MQEIKVQPLTVGAFAHFGDLLDISGAPDKIINQGNCARYHDRAAMDFTDGAAGISLFDAKPRCLPYQLDMMERHPLGSQAFIPMNYAPFLIVAAQDAGGNPGRPKAFISASGQAINFHRNVWHGVLTPLNKPGLFAVVDRIGEGSNLEEVFFHTPYMVVT